MLKPSRRLAPALLLPLILSACGGDQPAPARSPQILASAMSKSSAEDIATHDLLVHGLFVGYFGRPADPAGFEFFVRTYREANAPMSARELSAQYANNPAVRALVDSFALSQESRDLYPGGDAAFLTQVYRQMFKREPDAPGLAFWTNAIGQGHVTRASAVLAIMAGATSTDLLLMEKKGLVARQFMHSLRTAEQRAAFSGMDANQLARAMLSSVTLDTDVAAFQRTIDLVVANIVARPAGYVEVAAADRTIAFVVGPDQALVNTARIQALASSLAADLTSRSPAFGPRWSVQVLAAGANAAAVREQVKGHAGAILIGNVPVPTQLDGFNGEVVPYLDPLRVPFCDSYSFDASGNRIAGRPALGLQEPECRNGITISVLRGRSAQTQLTDIANKLEQMTRYHDASDAANAAWEARYDFVQALWAGGLAYENAAPDWAAFPLYTPAQLHYTMSGTAAARMLAFQACLSRSQEMCGFNGHGAAQAILFEGAGTRGSFYSSDTATLLAHSFESSPVNAKFVGLVSCSTQNFLQDNSVATSMLMSGKNLLTLGATQVAIVGDNHESETVKKHYSHLLSGATYAEAFAGMMDATPLNFQGDPYISARPVPKGNQPRLVIDGRHTNEGSGVLGVTLPDSVDRATSTRTLKIYNGGSADLKLKLSMMPTGLGVNGKGTGYAGVSGLGFELEAPVVLTVSGNSDLGNVLLTVKPGATLPVRYGFAPVLGNGVTPVYGAYAARMEILSNDPAAFHTFLELRATAR